MKLPFTVEQFLEVFKNYNQAVFPIQIIFYLLAGGAIFLAIKKYRWTDKFIVIVLSVLWAWMGVIYHLLFFTGINKAAYLFGALTIIQAGLFLYFGLIKQRLSFRFATNTRGWTGAVLISYALVIYPILGCFLEHRYPSSPTFGLPCPTTIFTFGMMLWAESRLPFIIILIPSIWAIIGFSAAISLGIYEDTVLLISGLLAYLFMILKK